MRYRFFEKTPLVGEGTYISDAARIIGDVTIGKRCYIGHGVIIRGDYGRVEIGSETAVEEGGIVQPPLETVCRIGSRVTVGPGAIIHSISMGNDTVIGIGAVLGVDSQVGKGTIVAEGSVIRMRQIVPDNMVVGGNPAHTIREVNDADRENWNRVRKIYVELAAQYLEGAMKPV